MDRKALIILFAALVLTAVIRLWIPWMNFSPIGAIALIGGAFIGAKAKAFLLPLLALFIGDLMLSGLSEAHSGYLFSTGFLFVYLAFVLTVLIGILISKRLDFSRVIGGSILAALVFFIVSNFGAWLFLPEYPATFSGLLACYEMGIPYFRNTLLSQLLFSSVLYLGVTYSLYRRPVLFKTPE